MTDARAEHPAGPTTAATTLSRMILDRVPDWAVTVTDATWTITDPGPDYTRWATIDATTNQHNTPVDPRTPRAWRRGPLIVGYHNDIEVRVQLPDIVDQYDLRRAIAALVALGVLPDEHGMTH